MWLKTLLLSIAWTGFTGVVFGGEGPMTTRELIQGVVARAEAVFSGKMEYRQITEYAGGAKKPPVGEYRVVFSGSSWRLYSKFVASELPHSWKTQDGEPKLEGFFETTDLSHRGKSVKYDVNPQFDRSIRYSAHITKENSLSSLANTYNAPPTFAGTFWFDCTKQFIQSHKDKAVRKPDAVVNGVKTQVLEWQVSEAEKFQAFHRVPNRFHGGLLRLYVSPESGFVLARMEQVNLEGADTTSFDSSEFTELAPGIFIPRHCIMQDYNDGKPAGFRLEYEITKVTQINEPIADSEFVVQLPVNTVVSDARNGKSSIMFTTRKGGPIPEDLGDILAVPPAPFWGFNWHTALIVGAGGAVVLLAVYFLYRRITLRRQTP